MSWMADLYRQRFQSALTSKRSRNESVLDRTISAGETLGVVVACSALEAYKNDPYALEVKGVPVDGVLGAVALAASIFGKVPAEYDSHVFSIGLGLACNFGKHLGANLGELAAEKFKSSASTAGVGELYPRRGVALSAEELREHARVA